MTMKPMVSSARVLSVSCATVLPVAKAVGEGGVVREAPWSKNTDQSASFSLITWPSTTGLVYV